MNEVTKHEDHTEVSEPRQQADGLLGIIQRVATDDRFDVEKMKALLEMRASEEERVRRMDREDRAEVAKRAWLREFSKVQAAIGPIMRSRANTHTKSRYADLADIERIVTPVLTEHGFSTTCVPVPCEVTGSIRMRLTIGHEDGHESVYEDDFPLDDKGTGGTTNKTGIQAKGSTQTYARRYLKASALDLAFMDDNDGNSASQNDRPISEDQYRALRQMMDDAGGDEGRFLAFFKIGNLWDLPMPRYGEADAMLRKKIAAKAEGGK